MSTITPTIGSTAAVAPVRSTGALSRSAPVEAAAAVASASTADLAQAPARSAQVAERQPVNRADLQKELDETLKDAQTALQFRVDDDAQRVVVSVVDRESGDVIYQIPTEVALRIAKRIRDAGQGMISESA